MIKYILHKNAVVQDPNAKYARVIAKEVYGTEDLIRECLKRGSTLTETDLHAAVIMLFNVMIEMVKEGNFLNTPVVNLKPSISGVFNGNADSFDSSRHQLRISASAGTEMKKAILLGTVEKALNNGTRPVLINYVDANTGTEDDQVTAGSIGSVTGKELDFDPANLSEGLFFQPAGGGPEFKATVFQKRSAGNLVFQVPALPTGQYRLFVRKAYTGAVELREGKLDRLLSVP